MYHVSEEGLSGNTMLWELRFIGVVATKVGAAGRQQRIAYEVNNNTYNIRLYRCSMYNWRAGYSHCNLDYMFQFSNNKYSQQL